MARPGAGGCGAEDDQPLVDLASLRDRHHQEAARVDGDLGGLELLTIFIDGIETAEHTIVAALGVDADGYKHPRGLWEGSTESKAVCKALINNLVDRGVDPERPILAVIDGGKGIRSALKATFHTAS